MRTAFSFKMWCPVCTNTNYPLKHKWKQIYGSKLLKYVKTNCVKCILKKMFQMSSVLLTSSDTMSKWQWLFAPLSLILDLRLHDAEKNGFPSPVPFHFGGKITKKGIILNTGASQKLEYHHIQYFLSFITESEAHILCSFITQSVIFQAFIYLFIFKVDDCGLQMRRTQN